MTHPNTVTVFDYGTITATLEERTGGRLVEGSPYIVMEYASRGTLAGEVGRLQWDALRATLLDLLDALAHAHARGIVHRDIKPANVLCFAAPRGRAVKLSDFGIAHAAPLEQVVEATERQSPIGTLRYMAPEQFQGDMSAIGPWTDLYALGITAFELVNGRPPFGGDSFAALARHHMSSALPSFDHSVNCPEAFEAWIRRMTAKAPLSRFRFAADAARALEQLDFTSAPVNSAAPRVRVAWEGASSGPEGEAFATLDTLGTLEPGASTADEVVNVRWSRASMEDDDVAPPPAVESVVPAHWRRSKPATSKHLLGAGLSLYGLRTPPMVGRDGLRDALWSALRSVHEAPRRARLVTLRGIEGVGTSRLADWLGERAEEVGAARRLRATFDQRHSAIASLTRMIASAVERSRRFDSDVWRSGEPLDAALDALIQETTPNAATTDAVEVRLQSLRERYVVIWRTLARMAAERPLVVWLDDVHNSPDLGHFFDYVFTDGERAPVLFVATLNDALFGERRLHDAAPTSALELVVPPLDDASAHALVHALLGLTNPLVEQVCARVEGNPLFAVRIVDDLVARGLLEASADGFQLKDEAEVSIPDSLHSLAQQAIQRVLAALPTSARDTLELAALLGREVADDELERCAIEAGEPVPDGLVERLQRFGVAAATERGWTFEHALFRESVERSADERGGLPLRHATIAAALAALYPDPTPNILARRAHHHVEAGEPVEAQRLMLAAAEGFIAISAFHDAHAQLDLHQRTIDALADADDVLHQIPNVLLRANAYCVQWKLDEGQTWATRAQALAKAAGAPLHRAKALALLAHVDRHRGDLERATTLTTEALSIFEAHSDAAGVAQTRLSLAILTRVGGDALASVDLYLAAHRDFEAIGNTSMAAQCLYGLGNVHRQLQDYPRARALYTRAAVGLEAVGNRHALAECLNGAADIDRYAGDLERAEAGYERAYQLMHSVGSHNAAIAQLNLGLCFVSGERLEDARARFEQVLSETTQPTFVAMAHALLLVCLTGVEDHAAFDHHVAIARQRLAETSIADPDIANLAQLTAERFTASGDAPRATIALTLALEQWTTLNDVERARTVQDHLKRLANGPT